MTKALLASVFPASLSTEEHMDTSTQIALNLSPSEIFNAEVLFRDDCSPDEFIDVIVGNRVYMPCLYVSGTALGVPWPRPRDLSFECI
jgi:ribosome-interacting GTPase 1